MPKKEWVSHPFVPFNQHISCMLQYHQNMHQIKYENFLVELIKEHDLGKLNRMFQKRMHELEKGNKPIRDPADKHAVLSMLIHLAKNIMENGEYDKWSQNNVLETFFVLNLLEAR
jgi:hypothetical protein